MVTSVANRTSVPGETSSAETPLGQILREFRWRLRMSQREAATALGVGATTLASYELGYDVKTRLPVNPREATMQMLARRMWEMAGEHGTPYQGVADDLYRRLMVAAGKLTQEALDFHEGRADEPTDADLARGDLKIPGLEDIAADASTSWSELDDTERRQVLESLQDLARMVINDKLAGRRQKKLR
jgi:transcriptional regulator with XRE-family HTH domain